MQDIWLQKIEKISKTCIVFSNGAPTHKQFFVENEKKGIVRISDSITFEQSQNWKNTEILLAITMSNFNQICQHLIPKMHV